MDEDVRGNRLQELEMAIAEKKRYLCPQGVEAKKWVMGHERRRADAMMWYRVMFRFGTQKLNAKNGLS